MDRTGLYSVCRFVVDLGIGQDAATTREQLEHTIYCCKQTITAYSFAKISARNANSSTYDGYRFSTPN